MRTTVEVSAAVELIELDFEIAGEDFIDLEVARGALDGTVIWTARSGWRELLDLIFWAFLARSA